MKQLLNFLAHADLLIIILTGLLAGIGITLYFYCYWVSFVLLVVGDALLFFTSVIKMILKGNEDI